jgi:hypothetical protein
MSEDGRTGIKDHLTGTPVDAAILLWADWSTGRLGRGNGCASPAASMMQAKKLGIVAHGSAPIPDMPRDAVRIDGLVARLPRLLARPFKVYYLQWAPPEVKARACGFGPDTGRLYRRVRRARLVIAQGYTEAQRATARSRFDKLQVFPYLAR